MPTYKPQILTPAQRELEEIAEVHFALVGSVSARKITNNIYHTLEQLRDFPLLGVIPKDKYLREIGYRFAISGDYLCLYRLVNDSILVYHIVHGAANYPKLFKELKRSAKQQRQADGE